MTYAMTHRPLGYLGQVSESSEAGEINGIGLLLIDLRDVAARGREFMSPDFRFSRSQYESMLNEFRPREGEDEDETVERVSKRYSQMTGEEVQTLIAGTVGAIGESVVRATALSRLRVTNAAERARNHALQASIIDPARLMWDQLSQMIRNMEARRSATSGLGIIPIAMLVAVAVVGAVLGVAAIVAGTYLADAFHRSRTAAREAEKICEENGGCSPEQYAAIRHQLQLGPFDEAFKEFGRSAGSGLGVTIAVVGIGGAAVVGGAFWYYLLGGREWIQKRRASRGSE